MGYVGLLSSAILVLRTLVAILGQSRER
jgi:hypothetical protein